MIYDFRRTDPQDDESGTIACVFVTCARCQQDVLVLLASAERGERSLCQPCAMIEQEESHA